MDVQRLVSAWIWLTEKDQDQVSLVSIAGEGRVIARVSIPSCTMSGRQQLEQDWTRYRIAPQNK